MMRVLVTGRNGQIARTLAERGAEAGAEIVLLGRPDIDLERHADLGEAIAARRPDVIVSAAAMTSVDLAAAERAAAFRINAEAPRIIAETASRLGVPIIHLSTDYVFDGTKGAPYVENDATNPLSAYGASKLEGEIGVANAAPDHIILRVAWIFSRFGNGFIQAMLKQADASNEVRVVADQLGSPTSAQDIADVILRLARLHVGSPGQVRGTFHFAGGEGSRADMAREVFDVAARYGGASANVVPIARQDVPSAAIRPRDSRLDTTKITSTLGIKVPDWRPGLADVVRQLLRGEGT